MEGLYKKHKNRIQLEMIILSKSERERQIPHDSAYMRNLKYDTNKSIYEAESQIWKSDRWLPRRERVWRVAEWEVRVADVSLCIENG